MMPSPRLRDYLFDRDLIRSLLSLVGVIGLMTAIYFIASVVGGTITSFDDLWIRVWYWMITVVVMLAIVWGLCAIGALSQWREDNKKEAVTVTLFGTHVDWGWVIPLAVLALGTVLWLEAAFAVTKGLGMAMAGIGLILGVAGIGVWILRTVVDRRLASYSNTRRKAAKVLIVLLTMVAVLHWGDQFGWLEADAWINLSPDHDLQSALIMGLFILMFVFGDELKLTNNVDANGRAIEDDERAHRVGNRSVVAIIAVLVLAKILFEIIVFFSKTQP
jgi:hypothetical protein